VPKPGSSPREVHVGFAMDKMVQEQIYLQIFWLYHVSYYPNTARNSTTYLYIFTLFNDPISKLESVSSGNYFDRILKGGVVT
jgi:hypothetical protein